MPFSIKPILLEISRTAIAEQVADFIRKCADSPSAKATIGAVAATSMPVLVPAAILVGMELFTCRNERKQEEEFQRHCNAVITQLHGLNGQVDETAATLDVLMGHKNWVWARLSGADQHQFARRVADEIRNYLSANELAADRFEDLRVYEETILFKLDGIDAGLVRLERGQAALPTRDEFAAMEQRLLAKLEAASPASAPADSRIEADLVAAVQRLARDARRGGMTARRVLETDRPGDLADYLAARRQSLDTGQVLLNACIDEEKIKLDRELAAVAYTVGRIDDAQEALRRILEMVPDDFDATNRFGHIQKLHGQLPEAEASYRRVLDLSNDDPMWKAIAYGNLGIVLQTRGDLDGAEAMYRKSLAIEEKLGRLEGMANQYGNLGIVLQTRGDLDGAEAMYRKSLAIEEKLGRLEGMASQYGNLGILHELRGEMEPALQLWRKSRDLFARIGIKPMVDRVQGWIDES